MRFGFSDGSCGSVRSSWRFQSPSTSSSSNSTTRAAGEGPPRGGVHNSGVWGLKLAKRYSHASFGEEPATRGRTQFGSLGPEICEKGTPTRASGEEPATQGSTQFGSLGPETSEKGTHTRASGEEPATRGSTQFGSLGPETSEHGTPTRASRTGPHRLLYRRCRVFGVLGILASDYSG